MAGAEGGEREERGAWEAWEGRVDDARAEAAFVAIVDFTPSPIPSARPAQADPTNALMAKLNGLESVEGSVAVVY
jgi:hypothetical protein